MKKILITCSVQDRVDYKLLQPFQGKLKELSEENFNKIKKSILEEGFFMPIGVWEHDGNFYILDGHQRKLVLEWLENNGYEIPLIPVFRVHSDSFKNARKKLLHMVSQYGKVTGDGLYEFSIEAEFGIGDLKEFSIPDMNMESFELEYFKDIAVDPMCDEDEVPDPPVEPITKLGDIYKLGNHRLMCGDSTSIDSVERLMDGDKADGVFTDPPYNIDFKPQRGTHDKILNDSMDSGKFKEWLTEVFACAILASKPDTFSFVWSGWSTIDQFAPVLRSFYEIKAMPVWVKNNFGIGYYSRPKYEPFFLCLNGKPPTPEKAPADVWEHAKVHKTIHSCEKPVGLIEEILNTYSVRGAVLDLFGGSGSTLIACEKTNRNCFMMELDPKYCDVIVSRYEKFTGKKAELVVDQ